MKKKVSESDFFLISPCYLIVFSDVGTILKVNEALASDLGYKRDEVEHILKIEDLFTPGSRIFYQTHVFPLVKMHRAYNELFLVFKSRNGNEIPVLLNAFWGSEDTSGSIIFGGIQISKRNRYEQEILQAKKEAERAQQENEDFKKLRAQLERNQETLELRLRKLAQTLREHQEINAVISHDLQEPLRKISIFGKIIQSEPVVAKLGEVNKNIDKLTRSADHMRKLVMSVQQFLSINEKRFSPQFHDLQSVISKGIEKAVDAQGVDCFVNLNGVAQVYGDRTMLEDLISELFTNAIKFRDVKKERLLVEFNANITEENFFRELPARYKYHRSLKISVSDDGVGFPEALAEEVFRLFRKAHINDEGYGVGLALCRKIIELHDGLISVKSTVGKGTTITFMLPEKG